MRNDIYLITGASSDVGLALCRAVAPQATLIVATANSGTEALTTLGEELCTAHPSLRFCTKQADLSQAQCTDRLIAYLAEEGITPTHFVHLPALRPINAKLKKFDLDRFYTDFELQVGSAVKLCKAIMPTMAKHKYGRVLFMLTSYINDPPKNMTSYVTVKMALAGLLKSLAADFVADGITVNGVAPSMMETKFLSDTSDLIVEAAAQAHPMRRNATVEDVVPAMTFLLSPQAGYITGNILPITGGA